MAKLTAATRNKLPGKSFAGPDRSYPIEDASHARNALARVAQHGSPELQKRVKAKVHAKYPGIGQRQDGGSVDRVARGATAGALAGAGAGIVGRALNRQRSTPDPQGRTGDKSRYDADAYPGYAKGGKVAPRIGDRKLRDGGPKYPREAKNYVR